mmetsp:Transcript_3012/g.5754  ORF Transcript_3012/g.5754 Transcript_3012/m.5754 type:complete len:274 (-) Transcript_3012:2548-3369(-)
MEYRRGLLRHHDPVQRFDHHQRAVHRPCLQFGAVQRRNPEPRALRDVQQRREGAIQGRLHRLIRRQRRHAGECGGADVSGHFRKRHYGSVREGCLRHVRRRDGLLERGRHAVRGRHDRLRQLHHRKLRLSHSEHGGGRHVRREQRAAHRRQHGLHGRHVRVQQLHHRHRQFGPAVLRRGHHVRRQQRGPRQRQHGLLRRHDRGEQLDRHRHLRVVPGVLGGGRHVGLQQHPPQQRQSDVRGEREPADELHRQLHGRDRDHERRSPHRWVLLRG